MLQLTHRVGSFVTVAIVGELSYSFDAEWLFTSPANEIWLMSLIRFFFTIAGPNLANDITNPDEHISICNDYVRESIEQSVFMRPVDEEEVITTVTGCTKKKSSQFDDNKHGYCRESRIGYLQTPRAHL